MADISNIPARVQKQSSESWIGYRQGRLIIESFEGIRQFGKGRSAYFSFRCDCGKSIISQKSNVIGKRFDCGCSTRMVYTAPDGASKDPVFKVFRGMHDRCRNPNNKSYLDYGGRGIAVCERWTTGCGGKTGFECFKEDMGPRPTGFTIERDDFNGSYEPKNCQWISKSDQGKNARGVRLVTIDGITKTVPDWCLISGVKYFTANSRIKNGWNPIDAITIQPAAR